MFHVQAHYIQLSLSDVLKVIWTNVVRWQYTYSKIDMTLCYLVVF